MTGFPRSAIIDRMSQHPTRRIRTAAASWILSAAIVLSLGVTSARADEIADANKKYAGIRPALRSDVALLPLLAKMDPVPKAVASIQAAMLLPAGAPGWEDAARWAGAPPQQAVLASLRTVTSVQDWRDSYAFGLPYGINDVEPAMIRAKMYAELGDPPLLAAAKLMYMPALDNLAILVNVEATRLLADKKGKDAANLLIHWVYFTRSMCDRALAKEVRWGFVNTSSGLERVRDVLFQDFKGKPTVTPDDLIAMINRLDDSDARKGYMDFDRIEFPQGDKFAARQLAGTVYDESGAINDRVYGSTMSRMSASDRPLRLFGDAGRWSGGASGQARKASVVAAIDSIYGDWTQRWKLSPFDRLLGIPSEYSKLERGRLAVIEATIQDLSDLFDLRQIAKTELAGTRNSMAVLGVFLERGSWPAGLSSVAPRFMPLADADPFNPDRANNKKPPMEYFVPGERGMPAIFEMKIVPALGANFDVKLQNDTFVLYSVGGNLRKDGGKQMQNTSAKADLADYLIWPPRLTLTRQSLPDVLAK